MMYCHSLAFQKVTDHSSAIWFVNDLFIHCAKCSRNRDSGIRLTCPTQINKHVKSQANEINQLKNAVIYHS